MTGSLPTPLTLGTALTCFPQGTLAGLQPDQVFTVPAAATVFRFELARIGANATFWTDPAMTVSWTVWQSNNAGTTWVLLGGSTAAGGSVQDSDIASQALSSWDEHRLLAGAVRQVKVILTVTGPMVTIGKVTAK